MQNLNQVAYRWLKKFSQWPRWAQVLAMLALMAFLAFGMSLNRGEETGDPFANPTALAFDVFLKLGGVILLIYLAYLVFRRWQGGGSWKPASRQLSVVETVHLTPRRALHLVRIGDQTLLIGATDQSVSLISPVQTAPVAVPSPQQVPSAPAASDSFAALLSMATRPVEIPGNR